MKRTLLTACVVALTAAAPASAAIFIRLTTTTAHQGGRLHVVGNAEAMPLYALPVARMPFCMRHNICVEPIRQRRPPKRPFISIGRSPGTSPGFTAERAFTLRLPRQLPTGRYKVFVWCMPCGGSLIAAGSSSGQTLRVVP